MVLAGELEGDEDAVVGLAVVAAGAVEELAADAVHGERLDLAEEDDEASSWWLPSSAISPPPVRL